MNTPHTAAIREAALAAVYEITGHLGRGSSISERSKLTAIITRHLAPLLEQAESKALAVHEVLAKERDDALARAAAAEGELAKCRADGWLPGGLTHGEFQQEVVTAHRLYEKASAEREAALAKLAEVESDLEKLRLHAAAFPGKPDWIGEHLQKWIQSKDTRAAQSEKIAHQALDEKIAALTRAEQSEALLREAEAERDRLKALINTPETVDFIKAVQLEAAHQRERWPSKQDSGKTVADWFWLLGYLGGKAMFNLQSGNREKGLHHIITTAAACANWHHQLTVGNDMRPGIEEPAHLAPKETT